MEGALEIICAVGRETDNRIGAEQSPGQRHRRVVLAHVHPVGLHLERQIGAVIEHEGHPEVAADRPNHPSSRQQGPRLEFFLTQLHHVDPALDAGRHERGQVGPVRGAQVEPTIRDGARRHALARALPVRFAVALGLAVALFDVPLAALALAVAFMAALWARTLARLSGPVMSATDI